MKNSSKALSGILIPTKWGKFYLEATPRGLYRLYFPHGLPSRKNLSAYPPRLLQKAAAALKGYFEGKRVSFRSLQIDRSGFTAFEEKVLMALAAVPAARTLTYGELSQKVRSPRAARAVGSVMRKNRLPVILPCHRVLRSGGGLGGYSQGLKWKKRFLLLEKTAA